MLTTFLIQGNIGLESVGICRDKQEIKSAGGIYHIERSGYPIYARCLTENHARLLLKGWQKAIGKGYAPDMWKLVYWQNTK